MAGRTSGSDRTRSYKTTTASTKRSSSTRRFATVSSSSSSRAKLAREKQRRQYEQQKREKLIFALFVVIILVMILFAILIFKKIVGDAPSDTSDHGNVVDTPPLDDRADLLDAFIHQIIAKDQIYQGSLILVNSTTPRKITPTLTDISGVSGKAYQLSGLGTHMETAAADAFVKMAADEYAATGTKLLVHRCYEEENISDELGSGLTVDVAVYDGSNTYSLSSAACTEVFGWLKANASDYGFIIMPPEETGRRHYGFRYVGAPHASYMEENELSLAAYLELLRTSHDVDTGDALSVTADGVRYSVYYVTNMGGDMTSVPIPADAVSYTISGDNAGGFIVTARMD